MKLVVAIIKPHQVEAVTTALDDIEVSGMTLTEVRGHGQQRGHSAVYRGGEYKVDFLPKVRVEVLATDGQVEKVANTIVGIEVEREYTAQASEPMKGRIDGITNASSGTTLRLPHATNATTSVARRARRRPMNARTNCSARGAVHGVRA